MLNKIFTAEEFGFKATFYSELENWKQNASKQAAIVAKPIIPPTDSSCSNTTPSSHNNSPEHIHTARNQDIIHITNVISIRMFYHRAFCYRSFFTSILRGVILILIAKLLRPKCQYELFGFLLLIANILIDTYWRKYLS